MQVVSVVVAICLPKPSFWISGKPMAPLMELSDVGHSEGCECSCSAPTVARRSSSRQVTGSKGMDMAS